MNAVRGAHRFGGGTRAWRTGALVVPLVGAASLAGGWLTPAGAQGGVVSPANNIIIGSGSQAAWSLVNQVDTLFNSSPGCDQVAPSADPQPLDFSCPAESNPVFPPVVNGKKQWGYTENPINDVGVEEPPLGSNNGLKQLEDTGTHGGSSTVPVATNLNYATVARDPASTDLQGLNFVAYAEDGVSWFHFTKVNNKATPSANVTSLTQTQLQEIFGPSAATGAITNWDQVGGSNAPIDVFSAQEGSATLSTWKTFLGFDPSSAAGAPPANVIAQNQDKSIVDLGPSVAADAIYYFPTSVYNSSCAVALDECGGSVLPAGWTNALGSIAGVSPTNQNILSGQFPVHRYLYNVYSNGSNKNIPESSAATLNLVSENGFYCKTQLNPKGKKIADPDTNTWYHFELESIIAASGFIPLPNGSPAKGNAKPVPEGNVPVTAYSLLTAKNGPNGSEYGAAYLPWDQPRLSANGQPEGYCYVSTTDSNSGS